jgi:diguanylate cyclase (GGDEF)-like protein
VTLPAEPIDHYVLERLAADPNAFLLHTADGGGDELVAAGHEEAIAARLPTGGADAMAMVIADRSGSVRPFDADDVTLFGTLALHAAVALRNVQFVDRLQAESALNEELATHDSLTGLANRAVVERTIDALLQTGRDVGVLLIDLDRFKDVNDTLGHNNGDLLLIEAGRRMTEAVGAEDLIARLGGDEFAIIVQSAITEDDLITLGNHVLDELRRPYVLAEVEVEISASIGIATASGDGGSTPADTATVLRHADVAMYTAKEDQAGAQVYRPERDHYSPQRLALVAQLRSAIERSELTMHYQPLIELGTGKVVGAEALVRWPRADGSMVMPDEFIHVAEHTGLIRMLSRYVIREVISQGSRWQRQGSPLRLSLNLSPRNLIEPDLPAELARLLRTFSLPPSALQLEMTETTVMSDPQRTIDVLNRFRATGVGIAIDDFGTGHSSLSYLTRLPATELKIDKSFVTAMSTDPASHTVVRSIIDLGRNLGLAVLAEGIETPEVAEDLRDMGCHLGQGYLFSRPLPAADFQRWMDRRRPATGPADEDQGTMTGPLRVR